MLLGRPLNSSLGIAAGPLLNSKWVEAYARLGFDVLTYATVRSTFQAAYPLPNIRHVDNREQAAVVSRGTNNGNGTTIAVSVGVPVLARLGAFKTPRLLHETATRLAPWAHGFVLVHAINRKVFDDKGSPAFEGAGRERADVVGAQTFTVASRQIAEMLAWRKAGAWDRAILAVGGISTVERARDVLREGADAALVATAALFDPMFAARFRQIRTAEVA